MTVNSRISADAKVFFKALLSSGWPWLCGECGKGNTIEHWQQLPRPWLLLAAESEQLQRRTCWRPEALSLFYIRPFSFVLKNGSELSESKTPSVMMSEIQGWGPVSTFARFSKGEGRSGGTKKSSSVLNLLDRFMLWGISTREIRKF